MKNILKETREKMNLSQEELAKKANVSRTIISELETGKKDSIYNVTLEKIATALDKKITEIFFVE